MEYTSTQPWVTDTTKINLHNFTQGLPLQNTISTDRPNSSKLLYLLTFNFLLLAELCSYEELASEYPRCPFPSRQGWEPIVSFHHDHLRNLCAFFIDAWLSPDTDSVVLFLWHKWGTIRGFYSADATRPGLEGQPTCPDRSTQTRLGTLAVPKSNLTYKSLHLQPCWTKNEILTREVYSKKPWSWEARSRVHEPQGQLPPSGKLRGDGAKSSSSRLRVCLPGLSSDFLSLRSLCQCSAPHKPSSSRSHVLMFDFSFVHFCHKLIIITSMLSNVLAIYY